MGSRCQEIREWLAALDPSELPLDQRTALEQHLQDCADCRELQRALREDHRRLVGWAEEKTRALPHLEDRIMSTIENQPVAPRRRRPWRWVLAAAAMIVILLALDLTERDGTSGVVWADVIARVEEAQSFVCRRVEERRGEPAQEIVEYRSAEFGLRQEIYQEGKHVASQYVLPDEQALYALIHRDRTYLRQQLDGDHMEQLREQSDARAIVAEFREQEHESLCRRRIDGRMAEGIVVEDPEGWGEIFEDGTWELWVDLQTQWPVRIELEGIARGGRLRKTYTLSDFDWSPGLTAKDFEFEIPANYRLIADLGTMEASEEQAIEGLRAWARLVGEGRYPSALSLATAIAEAEEVLDRRHDSYDEAAGADLESLLTVRTACAFYQELVDSDSDPAWYGGRVTARDFDRVLMRWRLQDGQYRVVYGDLRAETVSADELAGLERR